MNAKLSVLAEVSRIMAKKEADRQLKKRREKAKPEDDSETSGLYEMLMKVRNGNTEVLD